MRVGFYLLHPFWDSMASGVRTLELAKSLKKLGVEPIIFSPYEETREMDGIKIVKVPTMFSNFNIEDAFYSFSRRAYYSAALQKLVIKLSSLLYSGRLQLSPKLTDFLQQYQLDVLQAEQDNAALTLLPLKSKLQIPLVLDLHGVWPEELLAANSVKEGDRDWIKIQKLMKQVIHEVDLTVSLSDAMKDYVLTEYDADPNDVVVVPPGGRVSIDNYIPRPEPLKIVYAGIVSYRKHVDLFVKSIPHVMREKSGVKFYITEKGDLLMPIQNLASTLQVSPAFFWFSSFAETLTFLSSSHIGVLPTTNDTSARISMPSKLFDYLSMGLPVVANDVGGWTSIIKENNLGRVTLDSPKAFAAGILELLNDPEEMAGCGRRGIDLIKNKYNWDISAKTLLKSYEAIA